MPRGRRVGVPLETYSRPRSVADGIKRLADNLGLFRELTECLVPDMEEHDFDGIDELLKALGRINNDLRRDAEWLRRLPEEVKDQIIEVLNRPREG